MVLNLMVRSRFQAAALDHVERAPIDTVISYWCCGQKRQPSCQCPLIRIDHVMVWRPTKRRGRTFPRPRVFENAGDHALGETEPVTQRVKAVSLPGRRVTTPLPFSAALSQPFGGLQPAAIALAFPAVQALQTAVDAYCGEYPGLLRRRATAAQRAIISRGEE
jgi:hypothetical protein